MAKLKNKIQASTLIEVVVAMMITMLCFVIASMFINQFFKVSNPYIKVKAYLILEEEILLTHKNLRFIDETIEHDNLKFKRNVYSYRDNNNLSLIHYQILDFKKEIILEKKEIVPFLE